MVFYSTDLNVSRFEDGSDQREFNSLMQTVARNARAAGREAGSDAPAALLSLPWPYDRLSEKAEV